jgi:hypothetical protein
MARPSSALDLPFYTDLVILAQCGRGLLCKLARRRRKNGVFHSLVDHQAGLNRFIREHKASNPKSFVWKADPDKVIAAPNRGVQTLESIHYVQAFPITHHATLPRRAVST